MFNTPAQIILPFRYFGINIQDGAVATVANGMGAHLESLL